MANQYTSFHDRVWSKVAKGENEDACWLWLGRKNTDGYGGLEVHGRGVMAHRSVWTLVNGPIPDGLCVLHKCDRPQCVNPAHLFLGTKTDNNTDMQMKGRSARGQKNGMCKLTPLVVSEIRRRRRDGETCVAIANSVGVSNQLVSRIARQEAWAWLA